MPACINGHRRLWRGIAVCLCLAAASGCAVEARDEAMKTVDIYDLLVALPRAHVQVQGPQSISRGRYIVDGEQREALFLHPPGSVAFPPVRASADAVLTFKIGLNEEAWSKDGDGVEFIVHVARANTAKTKVFSRYVDPTHNPGDRRWIDARVPLSRFGNEEIGIIFETHPGPAFDRRYDWSVWAEPRLTFNGRR
jgi:hypothetical protein